MQRFSDMRGRRLLVGDAVEYEPRKRSPLAPSAVEEGIVVRLGESRVLFRNGWNGLERWVAPDRLEKIGP